MATRLGPIPLPVPDVLGLFAAALVAFGSTRPWARVWGVGFSTDDIEVTYVNGMDGGSADAQATLVFGVIACIVILWRLIRPRSSGIVLGAAILVLAVAGLVGMLNWFDSGSTATFGAWRIPGDQCAEYFQCGYQAGWGLIVVTFAGFAGAGALTYQLWYDQLR